jgi:hypothetical protein
LPQVAALTALWDAAAPDPLKAALDALLAAEPGLEPDVQEAQMDALTEAEAFTAGVEPGTVESQRIANWRRFASSNPEGP